MRRTSENSLLNHRKNGNIFVEFKVDRLKRN